jgi:hypothetical protein
LTWVAESLAAREFLNADAVYLTEHGRLIFERNVARVDQRLVESRTFLTRLCQWAGEEREIRTITFCSCRSCDKQNSEGKSAALSRSSFHERGTLTGAVDAEVMICRTGRVRGRKKMAGEG